MKILAQLFLLTLIGLMAFMIIKGGRLTPKTSPTPPPESVSAFPYKPPVIPAKRSYLTMLIGDSMTEALGLNADGLRQNLIKYYPSNEFVNYNYGYASTNILSLNDRLTKTTKHNDIDRQSILTQGFDLIVIESFAYNPLSEYAVGDGLKKYEEELDKNVRLIIKEKPEAYLVFLTPIAPNKENYAKFAYKLAPNERLKWVTEREEYIKVFVNYAQKNNIPLINVYEKSKDANGNGDLTYIDPHDFIHPSKEGVKLIEKTIADFIYERRIFPISQQIPPSEAL